MTSRPAPAALAPITFVRSYDAPLEDLWELWTTKDGIEAWWGPEGFRTEVHALDLRVGGELRYDLIAVDAEQIETLRRAGRPPSHESRGTFVEVAPLARLRIRFVIDFIEGVAPYPYEMCVDLARESTSVRMTVTVDPHHDQEWTRLATMGFESQLAKLPPVLAARAARTR